MVFLSAFGGDDSLAPIARQLADEAYVCFYFRPGDFDFRPEAGRRRTVRARLAATQSTCTSFLLSPGYPSRSCSWRTRMVA